MEHIFWANYGSDTLSELHLTNVKDYLWMTEPSRILWALDSKCQRAVNGQHICPFAIEDPSYITTEKLHGKELFHLITALRTTPQRQLICVCIYAKDYWQTTC